MSICVAQCFGRSSSSSVPGGIGDVARTGGVYTFGGSSGRGGTVWFNAGDGLVCASNKSNNNSNKSTVSEDNEIAQSPGGVSMENNKREFSSSFYSLRSVCERNDVACADRSYVVSKVAMHPSGDLLCLTERRSRVTLHVLQTQGSQQPTLLASHPDVAHLDVECLVFSGDGRKLALLRNLPDAAILLFSVENVGYGSVISIAGPPTVTPLACSSFMSGLSFHPHNWRYACVFGSGAASSTLLLYWPLSHSHSLDAKANGEGATQAPGPVIRNVRYQSPGSSAYERGENIQSWCAAWEDSHNADEHGEPSLGFLFCGGDKGRVHAISLLAATDMTGGPHAQGDEHFDVDKMPLLCPDSGAHVSALTSGTESAIHTSGSVSSHYVLAASNSPQGVQISLFVSQPKVESGKRKDVVLADSVHGRFEHRRQGNAYHLLAVFRTSLCSPIRCQAITQLTRVAWMGDVFFANGGESGNSSFLICAAPILDTIRESMTCPPDMDGYNGEAFVSAVPQMEVSSSLLQWGFCGSRVVAIAALTCSVKAETRDQEDSPTSFAVAVTDAGILHVVDMVHGEVLAISAVGETPIAMKALPMAVHDTEAGWQTLVITYATGCVGMFRVSVNGVISNRKDAYSIPANVCKCVFLSKVSDTPVSHVDVLQDEKDTLVVAANATHQFFFRQSRADRELPQHAGGVSYHGRSRIGEHLSDCAWLCAFPSANSPSFLCGHVSGEVRLCMFPGKSSAPVEALPASSGQRTMSSTLTTSVRGAWRLDVPSRAACVVAVHPSSFSLIVQSMDRDTKLYVLDMAGVAERRDREMKATRPNFIMRHHEKDGVGVSVSRSSVAPSSPPREQEGSKTQKERLLLTSWGSDGRVVLYDVSHYQDIAVAAPPMREKQVPLLSAQPHVSSAGGVVSAVHIGEGGAILSAGMDGVVKLWSAVSQATSLTPFSQPRVFSIQCAPYPLELVMEESDANRVVQVDVERRRESAARSEEEPNRIAEMVASVRSELDQLWHDNVSNTMSNESERVPLLRFLPKGIADAFTADCAAETAKIASDASYELLRNEYVRDKIEHGIAGGMIVPSCTVTSLRNGSAEQRIHVCNFPITEPAARCHRVADGCTNWFKKLRFLRRIQDQCGSSNDARVQQGPVTNADAKGLLAFEFIHGSPRIASASEKESRGAQPSVHDTDGSAKLSNRAGAEGIAAERQGRGDAELSGGLQDLLAEKTRSLFCRSVLDVATRHGAVVQSRLVEGVVDELKRTFNAEFDALRTKKRQEVSRIIERRARCESIVAELGENVESDVPVSSAELLARVGADDEEMRMCTVDVEEVVKRHPDAVPPVEVDSDDKQVSSSNVVSSSSEAALKTWMDGLQKESRALLVDIPLPDFADEADEKFVPPEDRTEEQQAAWKAFEKAVEKRVAEVNTLKEAMRDEYRRLCKESFAASESLDASILSLNERRMLFTEAITELELCAAEVVSSAALQEWRKRKVDAARGAVQGLEVDVRAAQLLLSDAETLLKKAEKQVEDFIKDDAKTDNQLHELYPFSDPASGEKLLRLFTRRKPQLPASHLDGLHPNTRKADGYRAAQHDPRKAKSTKEAHIGKAGQSRTTNRTSGGDDTPHDIWARYVMSMLSHLHGVSEKLVNQQGDVYPEKVRLSFQEFASSRAVLLYEALDLIEQVAVLQGERDKALHHLLSVTAARSSAKEKMREAAMKWKDGVVDVGQLYRLRQRQVETGNCQVPLTATWKTAMLVRANHISELNALLHSSSAEAAQLSREWSSKRKRMQLSEWEAEYLEYCVGTLEMELRHLHTLRVTREMQEFVVREADTEKQKKKKVHMTVSPNPTHGASSLHRDRAGVNHQRAGQSSSDDDEDGCSAEKARLLKQLDFLEECATQKLAERDAVIAKLRQQVHNRRNEALYLQDELGEIGVRVADCDAVHTLRQADGDESKARKRRMREVREARDLEDVARAQQDDLLQLKDSVDRLRERTFPAFDVPNHGKTI